MRLKEFFKPDKLKIVVFILLLLISIAVFFVSLPFGIAALGAGLGGMNEASTLFYLPITLLLIVFLLPVILPFINLSFLFLPLQLFYSYFLSCLVVYFLRKRKKLAPAKRR